MPRLPLRTRGRSDLAVKLHVEPLEERALLSAWHFAFGTPTSPVAPGYTGMVTFSSSDAQAGLPASYTFTAADAAAHTFSATLKTAGSQSITVKDATNAAAVGKRSAGTLASARITLRSTPAGMVSRTVRSEGTGSIACRASRAAPG